MLQFYTTTIPGMAFTFPGMIAAGGNWLHELLIGDAVYSMQTELGNLIRSLAANQAAQAQAGNTLRPTHRRDSCRDNGGCGVCNVCVRGSHAASVGRRHLRSSHLGSNRACHPHHLGADLHSVSGVRAAVVSVLGMVPGDDYLLALCRDRRSGAARVLRCRNLLHHELGECQPGRAELHRRGLVDDRRRALVSSPGCWQASSAGSSPRCSLPAQEQPGSGLMGMATTAGTVAATGGAAAAKAGAGGLNERTRNQPAKTPEPSTPKYGARPSTPTVIYG